MKELIGGLFAAALLSITAAPAVAQSSTVSCGVVREHTPATASAPGKFALVKASGPLTVVIPAGSSGVTFPASVPRDQTNWVCVSLTPGPSPDWTFNALIQPGATGYQAPNALIACGVAEPTTQPLLTGLRTSSGLLLLDTPADQRSPGYQCVRYLPTAPGGDINYFVSFVRSGDPGFQPQSAPPPPGSLPATSTAADRTPAFPALAGLFAVLVVLGLRTRGVSGLHR